MTRSLVSRPAFVRLGVPGWTAPLRVAQLGGLCLGATTPVELAVHAVDAINEARPDLVVLTGDFVVRGRRALERLTSTLAGLERPAVAVLGERDHLAGAAAVRGALTAAGVQVLDSGATRWRRGGHDVTLVALDPSCPDSGGCDLRPSGPSLGVTSDPEAAPLLWARGVPLVLSGRPRQRPRSFVTHRLAGGPWLAHGLGQLYASHGLGSSGIHRPAAGRVTILDLRPGLVGLPVERPWDFLAA